MVVYSEKAKMIEQIMLSRYESKKVEANHEVITDVDEAELISDVKFLLSFSHISATFEDQSEIEKYNES